MIWLTLGKSRRTLPFATGAANQMRPSLLAYLVFSVGIILPSNTLAEEAYYIVCDLAQTHDLTKETIEATVGSDVFGVVIGGDGSASYSLPYSCIEESVEAQVTETVLSFTCLQRLGNSTWQRHMRIDRVSGEYISTFSKPGENGLVHSGTCRRTDRKF